MDCTGNYYSIRNFIFGIALFVVTQQLYSLQEAQGTCNYCGIFHKSENEQCRFCNEPINVCPYPHTIEKKEIDIDGIVNAQNPSALVDALVRINFKCKYLNGHSLNLTKCYDIGDKFLAEKGIVLPQKGSNRLKQIIHEKTVGFNYLPRGVSNVNIYDDSEETAEYQRMISIAKSVNNLDDEDLEYPLTLKVGTLMVWCGAAIRIYPVPTISAFGNAVMGIGSGLVIDGMIEYENNKVQLEKERIERARIKAEKEAEKEERRLEKEREKEERRLEKEREKAEKEERQRQREEKKQQEKNKKKGH